MIREPYGVYPYNVTLDTKLLNNFSFIFNGDQLRKYDYEIIENNNKSNTFKTFSSLIPLEETVYNNTEVSFPISINADKSLNKNLIWRLRLVENNGDWTTGNIPSMSVQNGSIEEVQNGNVVKGILAGTLENLTTEDLQEVCVSLKTENNVPYRVSDYESRYYEYYTLGKEGMFVGEVLKEGGSNTYYWVQKTSTQSGSAKQTWMTRTGVNKDIILLKDDTGVYSIDTLFTQQEYNDIFKSSSVSYSKEQALADYTVKVLESFGYNETPQKVYYVNSIVNADNKNYSNKITRSSVGLSPNIYLKYRKSGEETDTEKAFDNLFTEAEASALKGYSITYKLYNEGDHTAKSYKIIEETEFKEEDEILYSVEENLVNYGTKILSSYNKGDYDSYPVETTKQLLRKEKFPDKASILLKDATGAIFSSETLFTKEEIDQIEDLNYGLYTLKSFSSGSINLSGQKNFYVYKNFYDTNYYYFQSRPKPTVTFVDENKRELVYEDGSLLLDSRYYEFGVKEQDDINTKYYTWTLYRDDQTNPIEQTDKIFSQDIKFVYENFLNDYSYTLVLTIETQDNANYSYILNNIIVHYDEAVKIKSKATAIFDKDNGCAIITWPTQKLSIPTVMPEDGWKNSEEWIDSEGQSAAIELNKGTSITYDNLVGEMLKIDPNNFILSTAFSIPEPIYRNTPSTFDLIKIASLDDQSYLTLRKDGLDLKIVTSKTTSDGIKFQEVELEDLGNGSTSQNYLKDKFLNFLDTKEDFAYEAAYNIADNYYNYYILPGRNTILYDNDYKLYETNTNLNKSRYKVFISAGGAFVVKFKYIQNAWKVTNYYAINNKDPNNKYDLKNAYFNKIQIFGPSTFKYLVLYNLSDISKLVKEQEKGCLDLNWFPTWDNLPNEKLISVDFALGLKSSYNVDFDGVIKSYRIYRDEYDDKEKTTLLNSHLIAEFSTERLNKINNNNDYIIKDYTPHNRGFYTYSITPRVELEDESGTITKVLGLSIDSDIIEIDEYYWFFTSLGKRDDGTYTPVELWKFYLNLNEGSLSHNIEKVFHTGFSKYPKVSIGMTNYITSTLSCLVGNFTFQQKKEYTGLYSIDDSLKDSSDKDNLTKIFIQETPALENMDIANDDVTITIHAQSRKIINYGFDYVDGKKKFFAIIDTPFVNFIPGLKYKEYNLTIVKDKNNENNYSKIGEYNEYIDNINIVNQWNNFVSTDNPILIKDIKGNCFIGAISNNTETYNSKIDQMPTTVNFTVTQIDDVNNYIIFDY